MIIDIHNQIGLRKGIPPFQVEDLLPIMDENNVDKSVVFSFPENIDNDHVYESIKKHNDRFIGFASINPWNITAEDELKKCFNDYGFKGLWMHPLRHGYAFDDYFLLDTLLKLCIDEKKPLLGYGAATTATSPNHFEDMAINYPDLVIIIAHMGYMYETNAAMGIASKYENVYLEFEGVLQRQLIQAINNVGADKVIFGSNSPYGDMSFSIEKVRLATDDKDKRNLVLGGNTTRLLNL